MFLFCDLNWLQRGPEKDGPTLDELKNTCSISHAVFTETEYPLGH